MERPSGENGISGEEPGLEESVYARNLNRRHPYPPASRNAPISYTWSAFTAISGA